MILKIFVGVDENAKNLLVYILKNISKIKRKGLRIQIIKVTVNNMNDSLVKKLESLNINRFPAMIDPNNKIHIGVSKIVSVIDKNIRPQVEKTEQEVPEIGSNPDLSSFWSREMFSGKSKRGRNIPRTDNDDSMGDDMGDIGKKMKRYERNIPKQRRRERNTDIDSESEDDEPPPPRKSKKTPPRRKAGSDSDDDNVESPPRRRNTTGNDMDDKMLDAFMNNIPMDV